MLKCSLERFGLVSAASGLFKIFFQKVADLNFGWFLLAPLQRTTVNSLHKHDNIP
jgi:hypothetical protein